MPLFSTDFPLLWWLSSSHTGAGHFLGKVSLTPVPTQQTQQTSPRSLSCFSPWLPEFAELCGKGWEALRCPHYSPTFPECQVGADQWFLICCFWSDTGRSANKPNPHLVLPLAQGWIFPWGKALLAGEELTPASPACSQVWPYFCRGERDRQCCGQTLPLAQAPAGTVTLSKQPRAAAAPLSQPSHTSSVSPSLLLCPRNFLAFVFHYAHTSVALTCPVLCLVVSLPLGFLWGSSSFHDSVPTPTS